MEVSQNSQKFRAGIWMLYPHPYPHPSIYKVSGTMYIPRCLSYFPGMYPTKAGHGHGMLYPYHCGTGVQNFQKFRVRV